MWPVRLGNIICRTKHFTGGLHVLFSLACYRKQYFVCRTAVKKSFCSLVHITVLMFTNFLPECSLHFTGTVTISSNSAFRPFR